jgi:hypothetical protein
LINEKTKQYRKQWYLDNRERVREKNRQNYINNREERRKKGKEWENNNKEKCRRYRRDWQLQKLGITLEQYEETLLKQGNKCAVCVSDKPGGRGNFHADHCHKTGKFRGLLCQKCNMALGMMNDDINILLKFVEYLNE